MGKATVSVLYCQAAPHFALCALPQRNALLVRQPVLLQLRVPVLVRGVLLPVLVRVLVPVLVRLRLRWLPRLLVDVMLRPSPRPPCKAHRVLATAGVTRPAQRYGDTASLR